MCVNLWQKKNLSKFKTTRQQKNKTQKQAGVLKKNEIIGCVNSVYKKGVGNNVLLWQKNQNK